MAIATSKTREQFPLSRRKIIKKTLASTLLALILVPFIFGFMIIIPATIGMYASWIIAGTLVFILVDMLLTYLYQQWYYDVYFYDFTQDYIVIKKGPITPREITIPYERVQDIYVDQDLLDRMFGLYDVHLSSATVSSGMEAHIDGVEKPAADGLRALLLQTVSTRISKKTQNIPVPPREQVL